MWIVYTAEEESEIN